MRLIRSCEICKKNLDLLTETKLSQDESLREYKCGHAFIESLNGHKNYHLDDLRSLNKEKVAYNFQKEGVEFIFDNDFNCLIADPMGLGKTIQAALAIRNAKERFKKILIIVKPATAYQWYTELKEWVSQDLWSVFLIQGSKAFIPPGFQIYLMSMDTLRQFVKFDESKDTDYYYTRSSAYYGPSTRREVKIHKDLQGFDLVIVDECHSFKNPESKRSAALVNFISHSEIKHKLLLSGTPIKNRADEYFVPLNLLDPEVFTSIRRFRSRWLVQDPQSGKYNRISPWMLDEFRETTSKYILRREKSQVLNFLPPFRRTFETVYVDNEELKEYYNKEIDKLREKTEGKSGYNYFDVQENLMVLRRITGMMKVPFATEYIDTFLDTTEDEKIAIGVHHRAVRDHLYYNLTQRGFKVLKISGEDSAEQKEIAKNRFVNELDKRVLIVQMLAGGVGLNLQTKTCCTLLCLEREWNAADEEQFEGRFYGRANEQTQPPAFLSEYMLVQDPSIDWQFHDMVERKRKICGETLDGWDFTNDSNAVRELVEKTISRKL